MKAAAALTLLFCVLAIGPAQAAAARPWPQFDAFVQTFVSADGRVIDPIDEHRYSTSEGQSYALFFALVTGDRPLFERLLRWTRDNLAGGDLGARLPAWRWGRLDDGHWGVADRNSASDADLWLAWTLLEAARIWDDRGYRVLGKSLAARILREETALLPGLGLSLLPAPSGFVLAPDRWRLNPAYLPLPLFDRLAHTDPAHAAEWQQLAEASQRLILGSARHGHVPDWVVYDAGSGFATDPVTGAVGSYDAIRSYLWAALMAADARRDAQLAALSGMAEPTLPPERVDLASGARSGAGPIGFLAALLPYQRALGRTAAAADLRQRITNASPLKAGYYDSVLMLFGLGFDDGRYCFDAQGRLGFGAEAACRSWR